jgi:hypothetical protein
VSAAKPDKVKVLIGPHHRVTIDGQLRGPDEIVEVSEGEAATLVAEGYARDAAPEYLADLEALRADQTPEEAERRRRRARRYAIHGPAGLLGESDEEVRYRRELAKIQARNDKAMGRSS